MIEGVQEPCEECGLDPADVGADELPERLRAFPRRYRIPLSRFLPGEDGDAVVRKRPAPGVWSALELACHVRDVFGVFDERVHRILDEDEPALEVWDHDAALVVGGYGAQDPARVAEQLGEAAEALATTLQLVPAGGWERGGTRGDTHLTVLEWGRYAVHEGHHHLLDVGRALRSARGR